MVKVIASQIRKGNVVELDDKLHVVLSAENFHPGKGTPTTQIDMRRINDGVKVSVRYKTTEMVEKAMIDEQPYTFLYEEEHGFAFMQTRGKVVERNIAESCCVSASRSNIVSRIVVRISWIVDSVRQIATRA